MSRHLGLQLSAYVDRRLDARLLRAFDQHLVACQVCRHAADQERRLLTSLRHGATPGLSEGLQSALLGLASQQPTVSSGVAGSAGRSGPAGVFAAVSPHPRQVPVPTVSPATPALHRSPRRAAMLAGIAASASAAAAIGLAVAGPGATAAQRPTTPRTPGTVVITSDTTAVLTGRITPRATSDRSGR